MGLVKLGMATLGLRLTMFSPKTGVTTSPYVHGVVVSIFTWYCFKQTLNLVLQTPEHSPVLEVLPEQHLPRLSFPYSFTNDFSLNSNTPEAFTWKQIGFRSIKIPLKKQIVDILILSASLLRINCHLIPINGSRSISRCTDLFQLYTSATRLQRFKRQTFRDSVFSSMR